MPTIMAYQGHAWACGIFRILDFAYIGGMLATPLYLIFIVYSYCQDMAEGGAGPDLSDLTTSIYKRQRFLHGYADPYTIMSGWAKSDAEYGSPYAASCGGGRPIFHGKYHEMDYPPHAHFKH